MANPDTGLLEHLNHEQQQAVTMPNAHALILAGAGSGKTRVLTTRIAWLLQTRQVSPSGLMAVTFTNKAAREMTARLSSMLPLDVRGMWVGTFHGLCHRMLRAHWKLANLPQSFQILDVQDQKSALKRVYRQFSIDKDQYDPKLVQWFINASKEDAQRPGDIHPSDSDTRKKIEIYQFYEDQCQREGVVDFAELLLRSHELLRDHDDIRRHYQERFQHLLIDEFQDTNRLQYSWIKQLCGEHGSIFAVGDDDQSIYGFRGARVGNMVDFLREYQVQHQIKLEQNYRSCGSILDTANHLISHNQTRLGKNLRTDRGLGQLVRVTELETDISEARYLVENIWELKAAGEKGDQDLGVKMLGDIAVLYRSNAQSRVIETELFAAGLPYRVYGGSRFFDRREVKDALAYLRLLENPHDDTAFSRVVNFPPRKIGETSQQKLQAAANALGCSLVDAVSKLGPGEAARLADFVALIDHIRQQAQGGSLREIVELVLDSTGLKTHYEKDPDGADRIENLDELLTAAESFAVREGFGRHAAGLKWPGSDTPDAPDANNVPDESLSPLAAFLSHAALEAGEGQTQAGHDAVQLMTVHAAKGLEFDAVFIVGLEDGLFPHENSLSNHLGLEEERRLMYVALTRARKLLFLSHAQSRMLHGFVQSNRLCSRFYAEMPEETLNWMVSRQSAPRWSPSHASRSGHGHGYGHGHGRENSEIRNAQPQSARHLDQPVQSGSDTWLRTGAKVFHTKFGEGTVLSIVGKSDDAQVQISFQRHGIKLLVKSLAKLTPI